MNKYTLKELQKDHFDYFGYHWCQSVITIGNVSRIYNDLQLVCKELYLNLLECQVEYNHFEKKNIEYSTDVEVLNFFCAVINPVNLPENIINDIKKIDNDNLVIFLKDTDYIAQSKKHIIIKPDANYEFFKIEFLKYLMNNFGDAYLMKPIVEVIL